MNGMHQRASGQVEGRSLYMCIEPSISWFRRHWRKSIDCRIIHQADVIWVACSTFLDDYIKTGKRMVQSKFRNMLLLIMRTSGGFQPPLSWLQHILSPELWTITYLMFVYLSCLLPVKDRWNEKIYTFWWQANPLICVFKSYNPMIHLSS